MNEQTELSPLGQSALRYANKGFRVHPLNGKIPIVKKWQIHATTDPQQIRTWWDENPQANIGIATGDGLCVIDFDRLDSEQAELFASLPTEWVVKTSRGYHVWLTTDVPIKSSAGKIMRLVDVRAEGAQVVAPPSIHPSGGRYAWAYPDRMEDRPPMVPEELLSLIKRANKQALGRTGVGQPETAPIPEGGRNAGLASLAGTMRARGFTQGAIEAALLEENQLRCNPPLPDDEVGRIAQSISRYTPGDSSPAYGGAVAQDAGAGGEVRPELPELTVDTLKADPQLAFRRDVVAHFVHVEHNDPGKWEEYKQMFRKANIGIKSVSAQMRRHALAQRPKIENAEFEDAPIRLAIPDDFRMDEGGIYKVGGEHGEERILPVPLLMTKRLKDHDTGEERVEIAWRKDGSWQDCVANRSTVSKAQEIVSLADHGLPITSNTSAQVVKYLSDLEALNKDKVSLEVGIKRTGWAGTTRFIPGRDEGIVYTPEGYHLRHAFNPEGTVGEWAEAMSEYRDKYRLYRLQLATAFAAPLIEPLGARNFILHNWSRSGGGKTAVMRAVVSVWGSPKLMVTFNSTPLGLVLHASMLNHLPVCINERQLGAKKLDNTIYSLAEGTAKLQGHRSGGLRSMANWRNIILTNGEEPLTSQLGMQGTRNRTIEIMGEPIDDEIRSSGLYAITNEQYGTAGPAFVGKLIDADRHEVAAKHGEMTGALTAIMEHGQSRSQVMSIALLATADYYSGMWVFGRSEAEAWSEALEMGCEMVVDYLEGGDGEDDDFNQGARIAGSVQNMIHSMRGERLATEFHSGSGEPKRDSIKNYAGYIQAGRAFILTDAFEEECKRMGMSPQTARMYLADQGYLEHSTNGRKRVFFRRIKGLKYNVIQLPE